MISAGAPHNHRICARRRRKIVDNSPVRYLIRETWAVQPVAWFSQFVAQFLLLCARRRGMAYVWAGAEQRGTGEEKRGGSGGQGREWGCADDNGGLLRCDPSRQTMRGSAGSPCINLAQRRKTCTCFLRTHFHAGSCANPALWLTMFDILGPFRAQIVTIEAEFEGSSGLCMRRFAPVCTCKHVRLQIFTRFCTTSTVHGCGPTAPQLQPGFPRLLIYTTACPPFGTPYQCSFHALVH